MIQGSTFIWLHLPKTGGTSTASLFRSLNIKGLQIDPDEEDSKHDSAESRAGSNEIVNNKEKIITSRRLANWLLSDWHHKTKKMGLKLPFEPVKSGLFYSLRLGGTWVAADYWIHYFKATECDRVIRLENLEVDSNQQVWPLLPEGTPKLRFPKRNSNTYTRSIEKFFGARDLQRIHNNNPAWSAWEKKVYGDLKAINPVQRFKAKINALKPSKWS